jgi:hypothetical protein
MRGFIDRGRDYLTLQKFSSGEIIDVQAVLDLYDSLRAQFSITEEDIENVETLLSLADLSRLTDITHIACLTNPQLPNQLRRFVDNVITRSVNVTHPESPAWLQRRSDGAFIYKQLVRALAYHQGRITVITTNYDCLVEFTCYCLGLPFTYNRALGDGIEILKLHGSSNWLQCANEACKLRHLTKVSSVEFLSHGPESDKGYIERTSKVCPDCNNDLVPVIVPPTWAKDVDNPALRSVWTRAAQVLAEAEVFAAVGFSLPESDAHIRHLLHIGFSSGRLRQALAVIGSDQASANRWIHLFRESWRHARFEARMSSFDRAMDAAVLPVLGIPQELGVHGMGNAPLLPLTLGTDHLGSTNEKLRAALNLPQFANEQIDVNSIDWASVAGDLRAAQPTDHASVETYRKVLRAANLDWRPCGAILPVHGFQLI